MSLNLYSCEACGLSQLTRSGFNSHLRQKRNDFCRVYYQNKENATLDKSSSNHEDSSFESDSVIPFRGDALGMAVEYEDDNFGQTNAERRSQVEDSDDDEDDNDDDLAAAAEMENDWEPPRPQENPILDLETNLDLPEPPIQDGFADIRENVFQNEPNNLRLEAEKLANTRHPRIVRFSEIYPDHHPGYVLRQANKFDKTYLGSLNSKSQWAPFHSKLDWEIARWAKCRGPGSTAFSELLAIDGVCVSKLMTIVALGLNKN